MTEWWKTGNVTECSGCGDKYIQDMPQEFLDNPNECHPDPRLLCPECRINNMKNYPKLHDTLEKSNMKPELAILWLAGQVNSLQDEMILLKKILLKHKVLTAEV